MDVRKVTFGLAAGLVACVALLHAQMPFRVYVPMEGYDDIPLPPDWKEPGEWVFGRLMYPPHPSRNSPGATTAEACRTGPVAAPVGRRTIRAPTGTSPPALRRLTRVNARSVEQPVNLDDDDDIYNWPWLCAGEMGDWKLNDAQAAKLRDYLLARRLSHARRFLGTFGVGPLRRDHARRVSGPLALG